MLIRNLSEAIIINVGTDGIPRSLVLINPYDRPLEKIITAEQRSPNSRQRESVAINSVDRIGALTRLDLRAQHLSLRGAGVRAAVPRADRARQRGAAAIIASCSPARASTSCASTPPCSLVALVIVGLAIVTALKLADRMVRPVGQLVDAAGRIEEGDLSARVPVTETDDEIQMLASAFNRMTGRLEEQTGALRSANTQLETRRAFIEAVLSSVTAGVIALDSANRVLLINRSAETLVQKKQDEVEGEGLAALSPDLDEFMRGDDSEANVLVAAETGQRTLAVKRVRYPDGVGADLRRHHRPADRPAPRRLVRHRPAHRPRDQEPADPDPARRRAAPAAFRARRSRRIPERSSG